MLRITGKWNGAKPKRVKNKKNHVRESDGRKARAPVNESRTDHPRSFELLMQLDIRNRRDLYINQLAPTSSTHFCSPLLSSTTRISTHASHICVILSHFIPF